MIDEMQVQIFIQHTVVHVVIDVAQVMHTHFTRMSPFAVSVVPCGLSE